MTLYFIASHCIKHLRVECTLTAFCCSPSSEGRITFIVFIFLCEKTTAWKVKWLASKDMCFCQKARHSDSLCWWLFKYYICPISCQYPDILVYQPKFLFKWKTEQNSNGFSKRHKKETITNPPKKKKKPHSGSIPSGGTFQHNSLPLCSIKVKGKKILH